jgi:hypothetical protein
MRFAEALQYYEQALNKTLVTGFALAPEYKEELVAAIRRDISDCQSQRPRQNEFDLVSTVA